jgi:F-type H+-transporting ATPase subunit delta
MTLTAVAARYAEALADIVTGASSISAAPVRPQDALAELKAFAETLRSSSELYNALTTPAVPVSRKKAVVGRIAEDLQLSTVLRNFLFVIIGHHRIPLLAEIAGAFELQLDQRMGYVRAEVSSARELNAEQRNLLNGSLERLSGKRVRMQFKIDESLIGGAVARIGSTVYDGSVRGQLQSLERRLIMQDSV